MALTPRPAPALFRRLSRTRIREGGAIPLKNLRQAIKLFGKMDRDKLVELSVKVDVERLFGAVTAMDAASLQALMHAMDERKEDA